MKSLKLQNDTDLARVLKLRVYRAADGEVGARDRRGDILSYWGPGPVLAVYYCRKTPREATLVRRRWLRRLGARVATWPGPYGDVDGYVRFVVERLSDIPRGFFRRKQGGRGRPYTRQKVGVSEGKGGV